MTLYNTAYQEALNNILEEQNGGGRDTPTYVPNYVNMADALSIDNSNKTFLESAVDTITDIPSFIGASVISGANQLYNIPTDIGNLFGADFDRSDTGEVISSFSSDLGKFYEENKEGVDLVGFILSSTLPGIAGVKVLNAGQRSLQGAIGNGKFGTSTGKAFGLLTNRRASLVAAAEAEVTLSNSATSVLNGQALKAFGAGFGQNALEGAFFEIGVAVTMFNSPILENQDVGDLISNIAFGAGVFGIVGGALDAAKLSSALKIASNDASIAAKPFTVVKVAHPGSQSYEKLALDFDQLDRLKNTKIPTNVTPEFHARLVTEAEQTAIKIENGIRKEIGILSGGDEVMAGNLHALFKGAGKQAQQEAFIGAQSTTRLATKSVAEQRLVTLEKKILAGKFSDTEQAEFGKLTVAYSKIWGESVGRTTGEAPVITQMIDTLGKEGQVIVSTPTKGTGAGTVKAGKSTWSFDTKYNTRKKVEGKVASESVLSSNPMRTNARYAWAQQLERWTPAKNKRIRVNQFDIPLLEKIFLDTVETPELLQYVDIIQDARKGISIQGDSVNMIDFIGATKVEATNKLHALSVNGHYKSAVEAFESKLSTRLGAAGGKGLNEDVMAQHVKQAELLTQDELAAIVNMRSSALGGELKVSSVGNFHPDDIFAHQSHAESYTELLTKQGSHKPELGLIDMFNIPQHTKIVYDGTSLAAINNFATANMVLIKGQQKAYTAAGARAAATVIDADLFKQMPDMNSGTVRKGTPSGTEGGLFAAEGGNYDSLASKMQFLGSVTSRAMVRAEERVLDILNPVTTKLAANKAATVEWSVVNQRMRATQENYGLNAAGDLEPLKLLDWKAKVKVQIAKGEVPEAKPILDQLDTPELIRLSHAETKAMTKTHIEVNGKRTSGLAAIRAAQGVEQFRDPRAFYPIPVDPRDFPNFAIVIDESLTGQIGHHTTLYAKTAEDLQAQASKMSQNPQLKVLFKQDAEEYYKSIGQYSYEKTINSNYLDTTAKRNGISAPALPATDVNKIVSETVQWNIARERGMIREGVLAKYEIPFGELEKMGEAHTRVATSKFGNEYAARFEDEAINNPFNDYIKTALAINKSSSYPWWTNVNNLADKVASRFQTKFTRAVETAKTEDELLATKAMLDKAGYKGAAYTEDMEVFRNATAFANVAADNQILTRTVQKANSVLAAVALRLDTLNAVNNAVSANVLLGAETAAVIRAIEAGDANAVGALAKLAKIKVPGTDKLMFAPRKLIANSNRKFASQSPEALKDLQFFKDHGYVTSISDQYKTTLDAITYNGGEISAWGKSIDAAQAKLADLTETGAKWTGNKLAEEYNRFVAADVMKQMTDVAMAHGVMTQKESLSYINTFVNRTQGNYLAAQRPLLFRGPIGQGVGLFQTYQFNLMQQLLRHVGEGHGKDAMTLIGLQGTIHGMSGLPAFNAINTSIIGNASGNTEHKDAFDATYGIAGKEAGDWLMYGLASNALGLIDPSLKVNLYTRGDINPRHVTIIPTDPASVPIVQATAKVMANLFETAGKLGAGGDVGTTILQGLEHNGVSRPLAGLAVSLQGLTNAEGASYSTSNVGNVIGANDMISLMNLGRIVGGKPLDEAIAIDATYRFKAYALSDSKRRSKLGEAIKTTIIAGGTPTIDQIEGFAGQYAETGGKSEEFSSWITQLYRITNLSQANQIQQGLDTSYSRSMQRLMGGEELRDFAPDK